jgi:glycosyltransferase involved in cell wall biosynthesis
VNIESPSAVAGERRLSIVLPAKNEAPALERLLPALRAAQPSAEIIVSDDGSTDGTAALCERFGVRRAVAPYPMGNGAAIKRGARAASGDVIVFMDADGQHDPAHIHRLLRRLDSGFDMVVGARSWNGQAGIGRGLANTLYNRVASWMTGFRIEDLTSGFRAVDARKFHEFLYLLPNGFSYPTTITMAFLRSAYPVAYEPIEVARRVGRSHIRPIRDGVRFLLIIFKIATLYSPIRYGYTYATAGRLTNMSALLWSASVVVFLIGLISEQITALMYRSNADGR